jgi:hexosaminidase
MKLRNLALAALVLAGCTSPPSTTPVPRLAAPEISIIPMPQSMEFDATQRFALDSMTTVYVDESADSSVTAIASYVRTMLLPLIKTQVTKLAPGSAAPINSIRLAVDPSIAESEGYDVVVSPASAVISARTDAGLFYGVQTLRQMLPASVEHPAAVGRRLWLPVGKVSDTPRFEWRGMMLDVSRHFLPPAGVKRFIDLLSLYKINRLHLHLADDQGWRIEIKSRPSLAAIGGSTQVGGGPGGFYTQDEYRDLVAYAASRFITIVPEIDMPGHTNAALASIPELNCDRISPPLYTGIRVGFSALCVDSAAIYPVLEDIVREISSITPGPYFHIGGDEVMKLTHPQYLSFIERMQSIVSSNGKRMIGWGEIAPAQLAPSTIVQNWKKDSSAVHAARGGKVILSPGTKLYLDQQYDTTTILGLHWAGYNSVRTAYDWDPGTFIPGVPEQAILGVEAPLWSETVIKIQDYEYLAFPRVMAAAEVGWTRAGNWDSFERRLANQSVRLKALGVNRGP